MEITRIIIPVNFNKKKYSHLNKCRRYNVDLIGFPILYWTLIRIQNKWFWRTSPDDLVMNADYRSTNIDKMRNRITQSDTPIIYKRLPKYFLRGRVFIDETTLLPFKESDLI